MVRNLWISVIMFSCSYKDADERPKFLTDFRLPESTNVTVEAIRHRQVESLCSVVYWTIFDFYTSISSRFLYVSYVEYLSISCGWTNVQFGQSAIPISAWEISIASHNNYVISYLYFIRFLINKASFLLRTLSKGKRACRTRYVSTAYPKEVADLISI